MNPDQPPIPAAAKPSGFSVRLPDLIIAAGGVLLLLSSFFPVVGLNALYSREFRDLGRSLWTWLAPLGVFVIIGAVLLIGSAAVDTWWQRDKQMVGLHRHHVQLGIAIFCFLVMFGLCFADPYVDVAGGIGLSVGFGGIIQLLWTLVMLAGAVLNHFNLLQTSLSMPTSTPAAYPQQAGYAQPGAYPPPTDPAQAGYAQPGYVPPQPTGPADQPTVTGSGDAPV